MDPPGCCWTKHHPGEQLSSPGIPLPVARVCLCRKTMEHSPQTASPWVLKSEQEIADFLSTYAEHTQQPLPTTFKGYLDLLKDNSNQPVVQYLRKSKLGSLGAIWRLAFLFIAAVCTSLLLVFPASGRDASSVSIVLASSSYRFRAPNLLKAAALTDLSHRCQPHHPSF